MSEAANGAEQELDLGWMARTGPWETRAAPGKYGLTIADISIGDYGEAPEVSDNLTGRPRGAAARPASYRIGAYSVRSKSEIWLDNASFLYEEALQRQWSSATYPGTPSNRCPTMSSRLPLAVSRSDSTPSTTIDSSRRSGRDTPAVRSSRKPTPPI